VKRPALPTAVEIEILTKSARRCSLCYGLQKDFLEKRGQIAHLDKNPKNHNPSNLVFLCLDHHDRYDGRSSQSKGYRRAEVINYRDALYREVSDKLRRNELFEMEVEKMEKRYETVLEVESKLYSLDKSVDIGVHQILTRCKAISVFIRLQSEWFDSHNYSSLKDAAFNHACENYTKSLRESLNIPAGVYGLSDVVGDFPESWIEDVNELIPIWMRGECTYDECCEICWLLDDQYDLDLHWILFGIQNPELPRLAYQMLINFVYVFGMRGQSEHGLNANSNVPSVPLTG
jgi:hypothetical protein